MNGEQRIGAYPDGEKEDHCDDHRGIHAIYHRFRLKGLDAWSVCRQKKWTITIAANGYSLLII